MIVASWSCWMPSIRASMAPGSPARYSRPSWRTSSRVSVQASASDARRRRRPGHRGVSRMERSFSSCSAFSAKTTLAPESARMNATSSAIVVG